MVVIVDTILPPPPLVELEVDAGAEELDDAEASTEALFENARIEAMSK